MKRKLASLFLFVSLFAFAEESNVSAIATTPIQWKVIDHLLVSNEQGPNVAGAAATTSFLHEDKIQVQYSNYSVLGHLTNKFQSGDNQPRLEFEKASLSYEGESWAWTLGDHYQELGRGLALSLYRDDAFGQDTTLQGVTAKYTGDVLETRLFGGRVNGIKLPIAINPAPIVDLDDNDFYLAGAALSSKVGTTEIASHYLFTSRQPLDNFYTEKRWHTVGVSLAQPGLAEDLDFYLESNALIDAGTMGTTGTASYASLTWSPLPLQVTYEVKNYQDYDYVLRRAPTLEADIVETPHENNTFANRLTIAHKDLLKKTNYFASYLYGLDRELNTNIHHGIFGGSRPMSDSLVVSANAGYRTLPGESNLTHASVQSKMKTVPGQSLEISFTKQYANEGLGFIFPTATDRNKLDTTYTFSKAFNLTVGYEYLPTNEGTTEGQNFINVGAVLTAGALVSRAFVGETSGGTLCSGGVCRQVPAYKGARLETIYTF